MIYCVVCSVGFEAYRNRKDQVFCTHGRTPGIEPGESCWKKLRNRERAGEQAFHEAMVSQKYQCWGCKEHVKLSLMVVNPRKEDSELVACCVSCRRKLYRELAKIKGRSLSTPSASAADRYPARC